MAERKKTQARPPSVESLGPKVIYPVLSTCVPWCHSTQPQPHRTLTCRDIHTETHSLIHTPTPTITPTDTHTHILTLTEIHIRDTETHRHTHTHKKSLHSWS